MARLHPLLPLTLLLLAACGKDPIDTDDTSDTDTEDPYEPGCITVDGEGGYAWLADALSVAEEGSVIALCQITVEETVTVDKAVSIVGVATPWVPPTSEPAVRVVEGGDLTLDGVAITATRTGLEVEDGRLVLADVSIEGAAQYGLKADDAEVMADGLTISGALAGAITASGGSLNLRGGTITDAVGFGLYLTDVTATVEDTVITGTIFSGDGSSIEDGYGIDVDGGSLDAARLTLTDNFLAGVEGIDAELAIADTTITGSYVGVWSDRSQAAITHVEIRDHLQYGVVALTTDLTLVDTDIETTPEGSIPHTADGDGSIGVIGIDSDLAITGGTISGHNTGGVILQPQSRSTVALVMDGTTVSDNARFGVVTTSGTMDLTDVVVTGTRNDPSCLDEEGGYSCNMAVAAWLSDLTWSGGAVRDNEMFGLTALLGSAQVSGGEFTNNAEFGAFFQQAAVNLSGATFDDGGLYGIYLYDSSGVIRDSTFSNASAVSGSSWVDEGSGTLYEYEYYYEATDIYAYQGSVVIEDSTFTNGEQAITAGYGDHTISDVTITGYNQEGVYTFGDGSLAVERTRIEDIGGHAAYCSSGALSLDHVAISDVNEVKSHTTSYVDGEVDWDSESTYTTNAVTAYSCTLDFEDVSITNTTDRAAYLDNCGLELDGVTIDRPCQQQCYNAAVELRWLSSTPDAWLNDVTVTSVPDGHALSLLGHPDYRAGGYVELTSVQVGDGGTGEGVAEDALELEEITATASDLLIREAGQRGLVLNHAALTLTGGEITGTGSHGIAGSISDLTATGLVVSGTGGAGVYLAGGTSSISGSVTGAGTYGMECVDAPTLSACPDPVSGTSGSTLDCACPTP